MLSLEEINDFVETQLFSWEFAKKNYDALANVRRRYVDVGDFSVGIQWNPGRIVSTGAKTDFKSINERPCFLCRANRPSQQLIYPILSGWEMLVNPYPIFPIHFTIVSSEHIRQSNVPDEIVEIAEKLPGMAVFFNGANAGASAPDHLHLQAVLKDELPLLHLVEKYHTSSEPGLRSSDSFGLDLPFYFISGIVSKDYDGLKTLYFGLTSGGPGTDGTLDNQALVNKFFWIDSSGMLRFISIPRKAHRPKCFYDHGESNRMVSPGCVDMAGLVIVPREEDFFSLDADEVGVIYSDVALSQDILK